MDDDPDLLLLLRKMLARIGATTTAVETGTEGLKELEERYFDVMVLDLMLPDMDGYEVLRRVRADERFEDLPVLILSARADPEAIAKGLELGADAYLTKPYLPNTLTSRVRTLLAQGRREKN
ncbi:MAG TPA: response regulator [Aggregatilineales bacterium]|nr:response regulator [Aggregatilineales bacterium]